MQTKAVRDVLFERFVQRTELGYSYEHDDQHNTNGELVIAAMHYAADERLRDLLDANGCGMSDLHKIAFDSVDRRTNLVRSAALLIAELERLDRQAVKD